MLQTDLPLDLNLSISDFEKLTHNVLSHLAFETLDKFQAANKGEKPKSWNKEDAEKFITIAKQISTERKYEVDLEKADSKDLKFLNLFAYTTRGVFNPLCAFFGGFTAQEAVKAITGKFSPTY